MEPIEMKYGPKINAIFKRTNSMYFSGACVLI